MAHDQEVMGSNTGTVYWMDVSDDASYYIKRKLNIKVAQMGHTILKNKYIYIYIYIYSLTAIIWLM